MQQGLVVAYMFRDNLSVPYPKVKQKKTKLGQLRCPETSGNCLTKTPNNPEKRRYFDNVGILKLTQF